MSHEIENMAYTGETPWHGLGEKLEQGKTIDEWRIAAGLDWNAKKVPVNYRHDGKILQVADRNVLVRTDTGAALSIVSDRYKPVQPAEVLEFFRQFVEELKIFTLDTAGCLCGGGKIWALAKSTDDSTIKMGADKINRYLLLATSYDKTMPTVVQQTSVRVVCNNTLSVATGFNGRFKSNSIGTQKRFTHASQFSARKAKRDIELDEQWTNFNQLVRAAVKIKVDTDAAIKYFTEVFYPKAVRESSTLITDKTVDKRIQQLLDIYDNAPGQQLDTTRGRGWGLVNAVSYYVDHVARSRDTDMRLSKAWFGQGANHKARALELVSSLS